MSTKPPNGLTDRTTPLRTWPSSISAQSCSAFSSRSRSSRARRLTTRFFSSGFDLGDHAEQLLVDELLRLLDAVQVDLADRQEAADAVDVDAQAALVGAGDAGLDHLADLDRRPVRDGRLTLRG